MATPRKQVLFLVAQVQIPTKNPKLFDYLELNKQINFTTDTTVEQMMSFIKPLIKETLERAKKHEPKQKK